MRQDPGWQSLSAGSVTLRMEAQMERSTEPGYEYRSCDFMDDGVYIDMNRLREYEDTGLTPEQITELKERDTAKEPKAISERSRYATCLSCRQIICAIFTGSVRNVDSD